MPDERGFIVYIHEEESCMKLFKLFEENSETSHKLVLMKTTLGVGVGGDIEGRRLSSGQ